MAVAVAVAEGSIYTKASGGQGASVSDLASGNALEDARVLLVKTRQFFR